jgi:predicted cupin superfamily sugar epimerase
MTRPSKDELIASLGLEQHIEGGYFKRTYQADHREKIATPHGNRFTLTSIFYLLTDESPIGHWHLNRSDIIHYFHLGTPITYYLINSTGHLTTVTMGPDPRLGQQLQLTVKGGVWKASHLPKGDYGLISEAVAPGFDYDDMTLGARDQLIAKFPQHQSIIEQFTR